MLLCQKQNQAACREKKGTTVNVLFVSWKLSLLTVISSGGRAVSRSSVASLHSLFQSAACRTEKLAIEQNKEGEEYFHVTSSKAASASALPVQTVRTCTRLLWRVFVWSPFWAAETTNKQKTNRKCFVKAAEEGFSSRPNTWARMLAPIIPDQPLYSTCWPGVSYHFVFFFNTHWQNDDLYISF